MSTKVITTALRPRRLRSQSSVGYWVRLVLGRLVQSVIVIALIIIGTAVMVRLVPGDPAIIILGLDATPESLDALRTQLGLDLPLYQQLLNQLGGLVVGDLGESAFNGRPVADMIGAAIPVTLLLVVVGIVFALIIALPLGLLPAFGVGAYGIRVLRISMVVLIAFPSFVIALYLLLLFGVQLRWAPAGGWSAAWPDALRFVWLPALALGLFLVPILVRSIERQARQLMSEEFVEAAIARGIPRLKIVVRHVLPNTLLPVITLVGYSVTVLIGGAVIIEAVYGVPGLGSVILLAVGQRDYPVIVGVTVFTGIMAVVISLITDVLYSIADPRVRIR